jgi:hypothetical protein
MNWRRTARRLAELSLAIALLAVSAWWLSGRLLDGWLLTLYLPALMLAMMVSGGPHNIAAAAGFIAQVLHTFLMLYCASFGLAVLCHYLQPRRRA